MRGVEQTRRRERWNLVTIFFIFIRVLLWTNFDSSSSRFGEMSTKSLNLCC